MGENLPQPTLVSMQSDFLKIEELRTVYWGNISTSTYLVCFKSQFLLKVLFNIFLKCVCV